jgi:hypothetical protein
MLLVYSNMLMILKELLNVAFKKKIGFYSSIQFLSILNIKRCLNSAKLHFNALKML